MNDGATELLLDELVRLSDGAPGEWRIKRRGKTTTSLVHSSKPSAVLKVTVQSNLAVVLTSALSGRANGDKLLVPFGSNADQVLNLIDIVARDAYALHFGDSASRYLGGARRQSAAVRELRDGWRPFFRMGGKMAGMALLA